MKKIILVLSIILITSLSYSQNDNNVKYVRLNANSPEAQADLEAMDVAFKKIRKMGCENSLAWYYQGAIHNIPDEINGKNILCPEYQTSKNKLFAWGDCTHSGTQDAQLNFLLWHRMYTWHFEKIVRELSGKKDFALPYWNYGSENINDNIMPAKIREKSGSLYEEARYSILNNGNPIQHNRVSQIKLALNELGTNPSFSGNAGFSEKLEGSPHGFMHSYIGASYSNPKETFFNKIYQKDNFAGLMANVPSAGFDPVFWLHHSMVDRIWESWDLTRFGQRPTLDQLETNPWVYNFIEPNGDRITYTIKEMYDIVYNLDYTYDSFLYTSESSVLKSTNSVTKKNIVLQDLIPEIIWKQKIGKVLGDESFVHKVARKRAKSTNKSFKSEANSKIILNLDIAVYKEPSDYYTVYLRYPNVEDQYVGIMTFFGVAHDHGKGENHTIGENGVKLNFSYYISDDLKDSNKKFEIIIKKNGIGKAKVTLENISMTRHSN